MDKRYRNPRRFDVFYVYFFSLRMQEKKAFTRYFRMPFVAPSDREAFIANYTPLKSRFAVCTKEQWSAVQNVVRACVTPLPVSSIHSLRPYMTPTTRLAVWAYQEGLPLDRETLLSSPVIEAFTNSLTCSAPTYRSALRRVAKANQISLEPSNISYAKALAKQPYTEDEIKALLGFANSLSNKLRKQRLSWAVLVGAGCGFARSDLRNLKRSGLHQHDKDWFFATSSRCAKISAGFVEPIRDLYKICDSDLIFGSTKSRNITDTFRIWVGERRGVPVFSADRLRATYVCSLLQQNTGICDLLSWTGLQNADALDTYLKFLTPPAPKCPRSQK